MNYATAKTAADIVLDGITVSFDKTDTTLRAVYFRDAKGNHCRVSLQSYAMNAEIPAPPKKEKRHILRGDVPGIGPVEKVFEQKWDAEQAQRELEETVRNVDFKITCEEIEVDEDGAKVGTASADPIPF